MTGTRLRIAFFGHDALESTIVKRVGAFEREGCVVTSFMFRRAGRSPSVDRSPVFIHLGFTRDRNYLDRLPKLALGLMRALRKGAVLRSVDIVYARNIDMLGLAWLACTMTRSKATLVYEVLDVQRVFTAQGRVGMLLRLVERALLKRCRLLVVSSKDFVDQYFGPIQDRFSDWILLENKVGSSHHPYPPVMPSKSTSCWRIGWFGTLRCRRSLDILCRLADRLAGRVEIVLGGRPSREDLTVEVIEAATSTRHNMRYLGAYESPSDLKEIYDGVHFSWCVDYLDQGANSDWLVPNRIYEGCLFGTVALARADTATGRLVEQRRLGFALAGPLENAVADLLATLDMRAFDEARAAVIAHPIDDFVDRHDTEMLVSVMRSWRDDAAACGAARLEGEISPDPSPLVARGAPSPARPPAGARHLSGTP